jgi:hypothetical protein
MNNAKIKITKITKIIIHKIYKKIINLEDQIYLKKGLDNDLLKMHFQINSNKTKD